MKKYALFLCATLWVLGAGAVATAQNAVKAPGAGTAGALGNATGVDETTLAIGDQAGAQAQPGAAASGPSTLASFIRMVLVLALVLVAMYLVFRLMKRFSKPKAQSDGAVKVLASAGLGTGKAVHVVGIGNKAYILGAAESSVSLIAEIDDKEFIDELELKAATDSHRPKADFSAILESLMGKRKRGQRKTNSAELDGVDADFLARQRDRLKKL